MTEKRKANMIIGKCGGNSSKNAYNCKVSIPKLWADQIGISPDNKSLSLEFNGESIIIKKPCNIKRGELFSSPLSNIKTTPVYKCVSNLILTECF